MLKDIRKKQNGFTIIEVMIVLAIAALILVVVLIAVPQLQRNQRNSARRSIASRIKAELDNYAGNNNGQYPAAATASGASNFGTPSTALVFFNRYFQCPAVAPSTTCGININDPSTNTSVGVGSIGGAAQSVTVAGTPGNVAGSIDYALNVICSGEVTTGVGASARNYAFTIRLEGGAVYCLDNR